MGIKNKEKLKKLDLLEIPNPERIKLINEVREKLRRKITEAKLWQSLLEVESLIINGNMVYGRDEQLNGLYFKNKF